MDERNGMEGRKERKAGLEGANGEGAKSDRGTTRGVRGSIRGLAAAEWRKLRGRPANDKAVDRVC